jgi:hypothetical protein
MVAGCQSVEASEVDLQFLTARDPDCTALARRERVATEET